MKEVNFIFFFIFSLKWWWTAASEDLNIHHSSASSYSAISTAIYDVTRALSLNEIIAMASNKNSFDIENVIKKLEENYAAIDVISDLKNFYPSIEENTLIVSLEKENLNDFFFEIQSNELVTKRMKLVIIYKEESEEMIKKKIYESNLWSKLSFYMISIGHSQIEVKTILWNSEGNCNSANWVRLHSFDKNANMWDKEPSKESLDIFRNFHCCPLEITLQNLPIGSLIVKAMSKTGNFTLSPVRGNRGKDGYLMRLPPGTVMKNAPIVKLDNLFFIVSSNGHILTHLEVG